MSDTSEFLTGIRAGLVPTLSAAPFGVLFGAVAVAQGQSVAEAALMSLTLFAGASQLVGVELFGQRRHHVTTPLPVRDGLLFVGFEE